MGRQGFSKFFHIGIPPGEWWGHILTPRDHLAWGPGCLCSAKPTPFPSPRKPPAYPGQADSSRDLVGYILPVDMAHPGAGDVLHAAPTHPDLRVRTEREVISASNPLSPPWCMYRSIGPVRRTRNRGKHSNDHGGNNS